MKPLLDHQPEESVLARSRERIMYLMAYVIAIFITPFAINNFIQNRPILGIAILLIVGTFVANGVAIRLKKRPPVPFVALLLPMAVALIFSLVTQGLYGALWCYPAVLFCFFVLPHRVAIAASAAMLVLAIPMVYTFVNEGTAFRFAISLALNIVVISIVTGVVADLQRELLDQAATDPLTGALNRRQMESLLSEAVERRSRSAAPASVLLLDIDHFKSINDRFGHHTGDEVLRNLVTLIKKHIRRLDRVFRTGGEEFLILLTDTKGADATTHAERLRLLIAEASLTKECQVTVSIGVAECVPNQKVESWIKNADDALYFAKQEGRNRVVCEMPLAQEGLSDVPLEIVGTNRRTRER
ncbi:MAG: diguanylate cyclase [Rhodospirillaceae bacterium]|nr:diguanylate cyclase [Rhodospirillaceae bacterium]